MKMVKGIVKRKYVLEGMLALAVLVMFTLWWKLLHGLERGYWYLPW